MRFLETLPKVLDPSASQITVYVDPVGEDRRLICLKSIAGQSKWYSVRKGQ